MGQVLMVVLLLCTVICRTESALHSNHQPALLTGRKMMGYKSQGPVRSSQSHQAGGRDTDDDPIADIDYGKY
ncbi:hypothetical protein ISN44_As13g003880 [Arabidopsis suecica]|uniref:Uncharacterized protein n=1 Tax=Arabidopsis suecica TaxID=45249 RepID=A0A8T1XQX0_ARASU|nr:hypothetical protein ISN44_As13g003880 [Arabidopsis suecica]